MPIILKTERRHISTWVLYTVLYLVLTAGAATMVYPFLQMVSGSVKSRVDGQDLDIVPRFLHDDAMLYRKYEEAKYSEDLQAYVRTTGDEVRNFRAVMPPPAFENALVSDWREFVAGAEMPVGWFLTGFGPTLEGRIIQKNERAFRNYVRDLCGDDVDTFRARFEEPIENWFFLKFKPERLAAASTRLTIPNRCEPSMPSRRNCRSRIGSTCRTTMPSSGIGSLAEARRSSSSAK